MSLFNKTLIDHVTAHFHTLGRPSEQEGLKAIVTGFETAFIGGDLRWLAYMLATSFHETAATMRPVREAYWLSEDWRRRHFTYYPYYGRGYVQLTHQDNYRKAGEAVGVDLEHNLDRALDLDIAAKVMFLGMTEGWFRRDNHGAHTLSRYFSDDVDDPVGARNIINGREVKVVDGKSVTVAEIIAGYHADFLEALKAAAGASGDPAPQVAVPTTDPAAPVSHRFEEEERTLLSLVDAQRLGAAVGKLIDIRNAQFPASHPRYWAIVDFDRRSDERRLHILDIEGGTVESYLCAHGKESDPTNSGYATLFSNEDGSNKSALGVYRCAETYNGTHGYSMRLDGLEPSNDQARHRSIVVHAADYVSDAFVAENHRVGRSLGCPAVDAAVSQSIIDRLKQGSFLIAWKS